MSHFKHVITGREVSISQGKPQPVVNWDEKDCIVQQQESLVLQEFQVQTRIIGGKRIGGGERWPRMVFRIQAEELDSCPELPETVLYYCNQ